MIDRLEKMSKIHRINVSTATSPARYNEYGERVAEVEMQLPSNLVKAENVTQARLAVTKLKTSLASIPACSFPVTYVSSRIVRTKFKVLCVPVTNFTEVDKSGLSFFSPGSNAHYFKPSTQLTYRYVLVAPEHLNDPVSYDEARSEATRGYHSCQRVSDFLRIISTNIQENILENCRINPNLPHNPGNIRFEVESDNTITLKVDTEPTDILPLPYNRYITTTTQNGVVFANQTDGKYNALEGETMMYAIGVDEELKNKLPTLPWKRYSTREQFGNWPDPYIYFLDTSLANIDNVQKPTLPYMTGDPDYVNGNEITYHFVESDAVTVTDVSSLILCMQGVDFNNQVLPVNIARGQSHAAQTTIVPIIDFYFPLWTRPSDLTTEFIVRQDQFSNAAPTNISPSLLKERSIKFKMYYVTNGGEMREMFMPASSILAFQLCIETI